MLVIQLLPLLLGLLLCISFVLAGVEEEWSTLPVTTLCREEGEEASGQKLIL
jgi:hypothetical protein